MSTTPHAQESVTQPALQARAALNAARHYREAGYNVVPIPCKAKGPRLLNWQHLRLTADELPQHFNGDCANIGLLLEDASGGLVDVDLDTPEALALAEWLPDTSMVSGRPGNRASHRFYRASDVPTARYKDTDGETLIEVRGSGAQTVVPP